MAHAGGNTGDDEAAFGTGFVANGDDKEAAGLEHVKDGSGRSD